MLSAELHKEIREVFEPRYGRALEDSEIAVIAENLLCLAKHVFNSSPTKEGVAIKKYEGTTLENM